MNIGILPYSAALSWVIIQMSSWDGGKAMTVKENALQQLMEISHHNDSNTWSKVCPHCFLPTLVMPTSAG